MTREYAITAKGYELHIKKEPGRTYCGRQIFRSITSTEELSDFSRVCWTCRRWAPPEDSDPGALLREAGQARRELGERVRDA
jgi:hypothetical protein